MALHLVNLVNVPYLANKYTIHAEQDCIMRCPKNKRANSIMVLIKITHLENVAPCTMCMHMIDKYKIKRIHCYSFNPINNTFNKC